MKVVTVSEQVFACYMRSCAPPPVGKGGSNKGGRKAAMAARSGAVARTVAQSRARMEGYKSAAKTYGVDKGKEGPRAKTRTADPATRARVEKAQKDFRKSGDPFDRRDERSTARSLTAKYGSRARGKSTTKKEVDDSREKALALTRKYGGRGS